jgi:hypothetical protein
MVWAAAGNATHRPNAAAVNPKGFISTPLRPHGLYTILCLDDADQDRNNGRTISTWMNPFMVNDVSSPSSQRTMSMIAIVHSM